MTIIPLHTDPNDDSWDTEDYSLVESELLPVKVFQSAKYGDWYWRVDHPELTDFHIGPFASARLAYQNMKQYQKLWESPTEMPDLTRGRVAMGAVESTLEGLPKK